MSDTSPHAGRARMGERQRQQNPTHPEPPTALPQPTTDLRQRTPGSLPRSVERVGWKADPALTRERVRLLSAVALDLLTLGLPSSLQLPPNGEPVLMVRARQQAASTAVVVIPSGRGAWSYVWERERVPVSDGAEAAAARIAGVRR